MVNERLNSPETDNGLRSVLTRNMIVSTVLVATVVGLFVLGEVLSPGFSDWSHIGTVLRTASFLWIVSIGQTFVILTAGIDLSVGNMVTAGNVLTAMIISGSNTMTPVALLVVIGLGVIVGLVNGVGVTYFEIAPLIMTLAVGTLIRGGTLILSGGAPKGNTSDLLHYLGTGRIYGIPLVLIIGLIIGAGSIYLLRRTTFGRRVFAVGANENAAHHSGVRVKRIKILTYILCAVLAGVLGWLVTGYTKTAYLDVGTPYTLSSIAAVVIGGTALSGGEGGMFGTILGAIILMVINSILSSMAVPEGARRLTEGAIILILLFLHQQARKRQEGV